MTLALKYGVSADYVGFSGTGGRGGVIVVL